MAGSYGEERTTWVHQFLARFVGLVCRFPRLILSGALLLAILSLYASQTRLTLRTQRTDLVNPNKDYQQRWRQYLAEFGDEDDVVVVVRGKDHAEMRAALDALAAEIQKQPALFDRLFYKVDLRGLRNRALLFLPTERIEQIQENIKSMRLLLEFGPISWQALTLHSLLREGRDRAGKIAPDKALTEADSQFLTQLQAISRAAADFLHDPDNYRTPWSSLLVQQPEQKDLLAEPQYFFSGDGGLAFLLVRPVKEDGSFTMAKTSVDALRSIVAAQRGDFPGVEFGLTGLPVLESDEMAAAERDTRLASYLALAGVTLLFFFVYRSIYYPLLTVATLLVGTSWAMGWLTLTVGHLNILSATFAVMLFGMGDYGVLWVMRYEHARRQGADILSAIQETTKRVAVGNLTAAATTALAFYAAMFADFQGVAELGWVAGSGVLLCAFACFTFLPALLVLFDRRPQPIVASIPITSSGDWLRRTTKRSDWIVGGGLTLTALLALCACRVSYDHNLLHLQAHDLDAVKWEMTLIEHTAGASWHTLSYTSTPEEALALKAKFEKLPEVSRVVEIASLVPRDLEQKLPLLADIQHRLRRLPERGVLIAHARPNTQAVKTELTCFIGQLQPLIDTSPEPLLANLRKSLMAMHEQLLNLPVVEMAKDRLQDFEERLARDLAEDLHRLREVSTPAPIVLTELPEDLRKRYLGKTGKWLLQVFGKDCLWDFQPLEHFVKQIQTVDADATGKPFATVAGLKSMKSGFEWAGLYAFVAIVVVLLVDFRSPSNALIALTPLVLGMTLALGIMGLFGLPLNPANMIAFPLILGVGVDNGVHLLHDYLLRKAEGRPLISHPIGRGVLIKALTTMIGFGTLMISTQRGLVGLGFCLTLGVGCCMTASLVFLPAMLRVLNDWSVAKEDEDSLIEPYRKAA